MKNSFKRTAALVALAVLVLVSGCSARNAVTAEQFRSSAESLGYTVADTAQETALDVSFEAEKEPGIKIEYLQFSSDSDAQTKYNALLSGIQSDSGNAVDTSTYRKYTVEIGDLYHVLIKNGNVVLYGSAGVAEKEELDRFFQSVS